MFGFRLLFCLLAASCFVSFAWAIAGHFARPDGETPAEMRLLSVLGAIFTALQYCAIFASEFTVLPSTLGVVLYLASLSLFWWTVTATRKRRLSLAFSSDKPLHLLRNGPYRLIRHPFYTAYSLFWIAGLVATKKWWLLIPVFIILAFYVRAARLEEGKFSLSDLSDDYESYRKRTGMFLPRI